METKLNNRRKALIILFLSLCILVSNWGQTQKNINTAKKVNKGIKDSQCQVCIAGKSGDVKMSKSELLSAGKIDLTGVCADSALINSFEMMLSYNGIVYEVSSGRSFIRDNSSLHKTFHIIPSSTNQFTPEMKDKLAYIKKGAWVIIKNVHIIYPYGEYILPGLSIQIVQD